MSTNSAVVDPSTTSHEKPPPLDDLTADRFQSPIQSLVNVVIQKSDDLDSKRFDELLSLLVVLLGSVMKMTLSVQLDTEFDLDRTNVDHECTDAELSAEFTARHATAFETCPEHHLGNWRGLTELPAPLLFGLSGEEFGHGWVVPSLWVL